MRTRFPVFVITAAFASAFAFGAWLHADTPASSAPASSAPAPALTQPQPAWPEVTREAKPWTRWWWLGSAVDEKNIARELKLFSEAGLGGVEITPIYGAKGYEDRFIPFLSPRYIEMLGYTVSEAGRLGLSVDMATGTGWPFGGPSVGPEDVELKIAFDANGALAPVPTKFKVKRAAPGGEGFVVNPYSTAAIGHYLAPIGDALAKLPIGSKIHGQFHDSFEYQANWAAELPAAFEKMHGYALAGHAALLATPDAGVANLSAADADKLARIKSDYRETLAALHMDYVRAWVQWTHDTGAIAREQAHGTPANLIDLYALADIPETEIFGSSDFPIPYYRNSEEDSRRENPQPVVSRLASSAAHLAGKKLASSETFTWAREHFRETPSELKPELDQLFLTGINHIFYHGTAYSPEDAPWPGWLFYASTQYNTRNPLWTAFSAFNQYITRVQSFLQMGEADNDMLLYWPLHDLWHRPTGWNRNFGMHGKDWMRDTTTGKVAGTLVAQGRQFDFISDAQLQKTTAEKATRSITTQAGVTYKQLLVPPVKYMPPETFAAIKEIASQGVPVIFIDDIPRDVPGFARLDERRTALKNLQFGLPADFDRAPPMSPVSTGRGSFLVTKFDAFAAMSAPLANEGLGMVRRKYDNGEIYFITNLTAKPFDGQAALKISAIPDPSEADLEIAEIYDPLTGAIGMTELHRVPDRQFPRTEVRLQLEPGQSLIVKTTRNGKRSAVWKYTKPSGAPLTLSTAAREWKVTFTDGAPKLPPAYTTRELKSWTEQGGEAERYAGSARYETTFTLPEGVNAADWQLDLGDVREAARVFVNGREVDYLWCLPFRARVGKYVKPGENTLAIEVTNLAANRIRDMDIRREPWKNFHEINFVNVHYRPLDASKWPLQPSGLLGPVTLTPLKTD
ncbi:MAG: hypothetical protein LBM04_12540 [Opitutaceae bacterium]|jgi:hypothetical protein|nr:hypothetical protein [Opitutaceae bacterium]